MKAQKESKITVSEYLAIEQESDKRYEYHNGEIFALAGGSINHGLLCGNIYAEIRNGLKKKKSDCKPYMSDIKLHIEEQKTFVYPDTMVVCGDLETSPENENSILNPILVVEVLSKSTANYDRGDKFFLYKKIATLQEYVLIEQDKAQVDIFYKKTGSDLWKISRYEGLDTKIKFQSINLEIKMSELYFDIDFA